MNKSKLNKKNVMLFSIILLFILCIGCVSAKDNIDNNNTNEVLNTPLDGEHRTNEGVLTAESTNDIGGNNNTLKANENSDILKDEQTGSFTDLNTLIKSNPQGEDLILDRDYIYNASSDSPIILSKPITIDGAGYSLICDNTITDVIFSLTGNNRDCPELANL